MAEDKPELEQCKLLNDDILVQTDEGNNRTESGLILSTAADTQGKVVKAGPGTFTQFGKKIPMEVKVGDIVRLKNDEKNYNSVRLDGEKYIHANQREISIIVNES